MSKKDIDKKQTINHREALNYVKSLIIDRLVKGQSFGFKGLFTIKPVVKNARKIKFKGKYHLVPAHKDIKLVSTKAFREDFNILFSKEYVDFIRKTDDGESTKE